MQIAPKRETLAQLLSGEGNLDTPLALTAMAMEWPANANPLNYIIRGQVLASPLAVARAHSKMSVVRPENALARLA